MKLHEQILLEGFTQFEVGNVNFKIRTRKRRRSIYHQQSARSAKANKVQRCEEIRVKADQINAYNARMYERVEVRKVRAEEQRNERKAKRKSK